MNALDTRASLILWLLAWGALLFLCPPAALASMLVFLLVVAIKALLPVLAEMWASIGYLLFPFIAAPIIAHFFPMDVDTAIGSAVGVFWLLRILSWTLDTLLGL